MDKFDFITVKDLDDIVYKNHKQYRKTDFIYIKGLIHGIGPFCVSGNLKTQYI